MRYALCLVLALAACETVSDEEACRGSANYWMCMQYMQAERQHEAAMLQASAFNLQNGFNGLAASGERNMLIRQGIATNLQNSYQQTSCLASPYMCR